MKRLALITALFLFVSAGYAQRFAYIDTDYILKNVPAYGEAQAELDELSERWQKTLEAKHAAIEKLYKAYQAEQILLTEDAKQKREEEILQEEKEAREFKRSKFGVNGELFQKRSELIQPIQDEIYKAVKDIAETGGYVIIFDKSTQSNMLYTHPKYDKSDDVLRKIKN